MLARHLALAVLLALAGALTGHAAPAAARGGCADAGRSIQSSADAAPASRAVACLLRGERRRHRLAVLRPDARLRRAATHHAHDMVRRGYFGHIAPGGSGVAARLGAVGYRLSTHRVGEALASARGAWATPRELVRRLMASPPHRAILLAGEMRLVGIGLAHGSPGVHGGASATLVLVLG